jgi:hypothetical protein
MSHIYIDSKYRLIWAHLVSPAHLTHLTVTFMPTQCAHDMPFLPNLRFLRITGNQSSGLDCAPLLSCAKCPSLETFELEPPTVKPVSWIEVTPDTQLDLKHLRSYHGPDNYAPVFAQSASLVHAVLWRAGVTAPDSILFELVQLAPMLKSLKFVVFRPSRSTLDAIAGFRMLEELVMDLRGWQLSGTARQVKISTYIDLFCCVSHPDSSSASR